MVGMVGRAPAAPATGKEVAFVDPSKLDELNIHQSMRMRIEHCLTDRTEPCIG
ncbi:hypothetical protein [Streptomyces sp. NPDC056291]|uniref:hypothetical protein n=1 Tax=unclassified Streptomyces TaxID=2593676 RepID=UPI0035E1B338